MDNVLKVYSNVNFILLSKYCGYSLTHLECIEAKISLLYSLDCGVIHNILGCIHLCRSFLIRCTACCSYPFTFLLLFLILYFIKLN